MTGTDGPTRQIEPIFYELFGRFVSHWALVEHALADLLTFYLKSDPSMTNLLAQTVSASMVTDWVRKISSFKAGPEDDLQELDDILAEIDHIRGERNALVHGLWTTHSSDAGTIVLLNFRLHATAPAKQRLITLDDLSSLIEETLTVYAELVKFLRARGAFLG